MLVQASRRRPDAAESPPPSGHRHPFVLGLVSIALLEMGDKTQLAEVALAARLHHPVAVFLGSWLALSLISVLAVAVGGTLTRLVSARTMEFVAGGLFLVVG